MKPHLSGWGFFIVQSEKIMRNRHLFHFFIYLWFTNQYKRTMENTINQPITSKYSGVVEKVRNYQHKGMCLTHAVNQAIKDSVGKIYTQEDERILRSWFFNSFA